MAYFCHSFASHTCCGLVHEAGLSGRGTEDFSKPLDLREMLMRKVTFLEPGKYHCVKPYRY